MVNLIAAPFKLVSHLKSLSKTKPLLVGNSLNGLLIHTHTTR